MYASDMWELERGVPVLLSGYGGLMEEGHNYTFEDDSDVPVPYFNLLWSSREVSLDVSLASLSYCYKCLLIESTCSMSIETGSPVTGPIHSCLERTNTRAR